jgi:hypothetical protein
VKRCGKIAHATRGIRQVDLSSSVGSRFSGLVTTSVAVVIDRFRKTSHQRELAALSDRQLRDAGIDLSLAGRSKAAAASPAVLRRLQDLSWS